MAALFKCFKASPNIEDTIIQPENQATRRTASYILKTPTPTTTGTNIPLSALKASDKSKFFYYSPKFNFEDDQPINTFKTPSAAALLKSPQPELVKYEILASERRCHSKTKKKLHKMEEKYQDLKHETFKWQSFSKNLQRDLIYLQNEIELIKREQVEKERNQNEQRVSYQTFTSTRTRFSQSHLHSNDQSRDKSIQIINQRPMFTLPPAPRLPSYSEASSIKKDLFKELSNKLVPVAVKTPKATKTNETITLTPNSKKKVVRKSISKRNEAMFKKLMTVQADTRFESTEGENGAFQSAILRSATVHKNGHLSSNSSGYNSNSFEGQKSRKVSVKRMYKGRGACG